VGRTGVGGEEEKKELDKKASEKGVWGGESWRMGVAESRGGEEEGGESRMDGGRRESGGKGGGKKGRGESWESGRGEVGWIRGE